MKLNRIERALLHNPVRPIVQSHLEARQLLRLGGPIAGRHALEIGCGMGYGIHLILEKFHAARVDAFDIDFRSLAAARHPDLY
jgi:methylase of polypeptide subunit release factors